ncbi:restriction endonuclease subunit S [Clostridium sp. 3-3]|uniref:restriction endonuclease subunit S n=1 Tax=Clostridium sp. 3-3 TaxID=2070757 RepID=UPI000CDA31AD|nr:restriction endonuclease subunit S [Clostridium sp. 3-3]POO87269.1 restriction endonuclease subunit S [Clostridium sp. 3-3]
MQLSAENIKKLIVKMGFTPQNGKNNVYFKAYRLHNGYVIRVDFNTEKIEYYTQDAPKDSRITLGDGTTSNFSHAENFVVLECVDRLLEKGYAPSCIELEKTYPSGRGHSGRLDILVNTLEGQAFLMIECKTWGKEYEKEQKKMLADGGQLFTYYKHAVAAKHLCLYSSRYAKNKIDYVNSIVDIQEEWAALSEVKDIYEHWNKVFKSNGIFESYSSPYNIVHKRLTYGDLENMQEEDSGKIFNQIMEILRHNGISDKPNAFNKLLNLFVCKIIDEDKNEGDELEFQCWDGLTDEKLQMTLNDLYREGMWRFLNIEVIDHSMDEVSEKLDGISDATHKAALMNIISDLRLKKSPNFAFVEVLDDKTFRLNAKVVREIVELLQGYRFRYEQKHEFLGNFFELLLNTSMKQEAGQFFTPVPITRFIISSLPLYFFVQKRVDKKSNDPLPTIIDYACGSGHFLTEFMAQLQDVVESVDIQNASPSIKKRFASWRDSVKFSWAEEYVYGIDFDNRLVKTTKVSAFFNGDGEANIVWGNGLDNFERSSEYRGKLKRTLPGSTKDNGQFDILISNPPYSVQSFRRMLKDGAETFELYDGLTDNSSEIECLFVERTKQLLKVGGWAGIILPSSMLSNGGIYMRSRDIIFKYFTIKAIVELGSGTFMKTGTNTVIMFLERRADSEYENIKQAIETFFINKRDVTVLGIEHAFSKYVANVYDDLSFEDYVSFVNESATETMKSHDLWKDYIKDYGDNIYTKAFDIEREKMLYFLLTYNQNIVLVKSGQKQDEKAFLGYEFSERRGQEGIRRLPKGTMLFDESGDVLNPQKINSYIYNAFLGEPPTEINESVAKHVSYGRMSSFFEYGTRKFDKRVNLNKKGKIILPSEIYEIVQLGSIAEITKGQSITTAQTVSGNIPVVAGGITPSTTHDTANREADIITVSASGANAGYLNYWDVPIFASDCNTIRSKDESHVLTKYLFLCLKTLQSEIFGLQAGQAQPHVYEKDLREIKLPLPSLDIQRKIISDFEAVELEIENTKNSIVSTDSEITMQFAAMFGDPVKNDKNWPIALIKDFSTVKIGPFGSLLHAADYVENGIPLINPSHILNGEIVPDCKLTLTPEKYSQLSAYALQDGDIVLGRRGEIGRCAVVNSGRYLCGTGSMFIRIERGYLPILLQRILSSDSMRKVLESKAVGITMMNINADIISNLKIIMPPIELQTRFAEIVDERKRIQTELKKTLEELNKKCGMILEKYL